MKRKLSLVFLSSLLLLTLTACENSGNAAAEMTPEEIQTTLESFAAEFPKTETNEITLTPIANDEVAEYSATFDLTWNAESGRYSSEKAMDQYSRELAMNVMQGTPSVTALDVNWMIPYHSQSEISMAYSFERKRDQVWQTSLYDRFTDGSFGADAYLEEPLEIIASPTEVRSAPIAALTPQAASQMQGTLAPTALQVEIGNAELPRAASPFVESLPEPAAEPPVQLLNEQPAEPQAEQAASAPAQQQSSPEAAQTQSTVASGANTQQSPVQPAQQPPVQSTSTASQNASSGISSNDGRLSADGTTDRNGRAVYVTKWGDCWHYDNNCNQGNYYPPAPGEIARRELRPCEKCVL